MAQAGQFLWRGRTSFAGLGLAILVTWAGLCAIWNTYGAIQISTGGRALGPTASLLTAGFTILLAILLILASERWPRLFRWLTIVAAALAALTIWNAFRLAPSLWPSEFWRWAGVALNGLGVVGALIALIGSGTNEKHAS